MSSVAPRPSSVPAGKLRIVDLIRPHRKALALAVLAVIGQTLADILEPWPIKLVVDNVVQSKKLPDAWPAVVVERLGDDRFAILNFALAAVIVIALVGAVSAYT